MQELKLKANTGAVLVAVENENGRKIGEFEFIPTDSDIANRYGKVVDFFNHVEFHDKSDKVEDRAEEIRRFSEEIRKQFDLLFNYPVSDSIFSQCGPLTTTQDGDFFFEHVLDGIAGIIEQTMNTRLEKKMKKIRNATAKYHK